MKLLYKEDYMRERALKMDILDVSPILWFID